MVRRSTAAAKSAVLKKLRAAKGPRSPRRLIDELKREQKLSETIARHAIWRLLDAGEIQLTWDRKLAKTREDGEATRGLRSAS